ncbi:hypothetical protein FGB62_2g513 [Gracilaria domingensis]|nr:hypothetical protein FGB62_2g513 [Gracilaria domingensis]
MRLRVAGVVLHACTASSGGFWVRPAAGLPGWVMDSSHVHGLDVNEGDACKRLDAVLKSWLARRYRAELSDIHRVVTDQNRAVENEAANSSVAETEKENNR